jgi:hypothetical protein
VKHAIERGEIVNLTGLEAVGNKLIDELLDRAIESAKGGMVKVNSILAFWPVAARAPSLFSPRNRRSSRRSLRPKIG